ncbi:MAG: tape measure protein [Atopobiaceae bacterium]|nr:tape measure protein [Atopobiaceae bacterium]
MATEVGTAYVTLMPSMDKFNSAVRSSLKSGSAFSGMADQAADALKGAGARGGSGFASSFLSKAGGITGGLASIASKAASSASSALSSLGSHVTSGIRTAASNVGSMFASVAGSQLTSAGHALGINLGGGITSGLTASKIAIGGVISGIAQSAIGAVTGSMGSAIGRLDTLKNFPHIMANMGISEEVAKASIDELSESIDGLPTSLDELVSFAQKIVPAFGRDMGLATRSAIAFNHAIVAGGKDASLQANALEQWSQMLAAGKGDMAAWRSVVNAAPAQLQQVAESMGFASTMELYNNLVGSKDGTIPLTELNEAFLRLEDEGLGGYASFAEQAATATAGIGTAITNVRNRISKALASGLDWVGQENISGLINSVSSQFGPWMTSLTQTLDRLDVKGRIARVSDAFSAAMGTIRPALEPVAIALGGIVGESLPLAEQLLGSIAQKASELAEPLAAGVTPVLDHVREILPTVEGWLSDIATTFMGVKADTWTAALSMWESVAEAVLPLIPGILEASGTVGVALADTIGSVASDVAPYLAEAFGIVSGFLADAIPYAGELVSLLAPHIPTLMQACADVAEALMPAVQRIVTALEPHIDPIADLFVKAADLLAPAIADVFETLAPHIPTITKMVERVIEFVANHLPDLADTVGLLVENAAPILDTVIDIADYWLPHILNVIDIIGSALRWVHDNVLRPIVDGFGQIGGWMESLPSVDLGFLLPTGLAFAAGGIVTRPTSALIGEAGVPEAVVPLSAQGIAQFTAGLGARSPSGGLTVQVSIDTFVNNDTATDVRALSDEIGRDTQRRMREMGLVGA